ncbi:hypothetical protein JCM11641_003376 [Rhodosporidiobolus odoratus]
MQGFNKYYPPDYDPEKYTSLNAYRGKHALGDRARKIDQGILVVRFELPYNIWCNGCNNHIGQGVRYNAEKKRVGSYYSSAIWSFRMKCHLCQGWIEIRTDPQNTRYVVTEGARQKNETAEDPEADGMMVVGSSSGSGLDAPPPDPFASLEKTVTQKAVALSTSARLDALHEQNSRAWDDPFEASLKLRASFRKRKKVELASEAKAEGVKDKYALGKAVDMEMLRTPARGSTEAEEERREWEAARAERARLDEERGKKRQREEDQLLLSSRSRRRHSITTTLRLSSAISTRQIAKLPRSSSTTVLASTSSSQKLPSSTSSAVNPAAKALHAKLSLATKLKRDPFSLPSSTSTSSLRTLSSSPKSTATASSLPLSRSAPAGLAGLTNARK